MSAPPTLQSEYREDSLVIRVHGRALIEKMAETAQAIAVVMRAQPVRAVLIDLRAVPGPVGFIDRYQLGAMAARHLPRVSLAALAHEEQLDPKRVGQLAARNRGADIELFTDEAQAEAWLKKTPARDSNPPGKPA